VLRERSLVALAMNSRVSNVVFIIDKQVVIWDCSDFYVLLDNIDDDYDDDDDDDDDDDVDVQVQSRRTTAT